MKPTSKGQVTIPRAVRKVLGISPDTLLAVEVREEGVLLRPLKVRPAVVPVEKAAAEFRTLSDSVRKGLERRAVDPKTLLEGLMS